MRIIALGTHSRGSVATYGGALVFLIGGIFASPVSAQVPRITSITPQVATRSGMVVIAGDHLGTKKNASILIGGQPAWATTWNDRQITAYVPESAALGPVPVQLSGSLSSAAVSILTVQERKPELPTAQGTVAWRFEVLANYISHRADVGRDGTVYVNDSSGFLYALTPAGALKWVYDGGGVGSSGPTVVGRDGTIYFGVSAPGPAIHAVNPDGTRKWVFSGGSSQGPIGGPGVGPDGNIYAVFDLPGSFAVSLTPAGVVRWTNPGNPSVGEVGQVGRELAFARDRFYWTSTYYGDIFGFALVDGAQVFFDNIGVALQSATARNGTLYVPSRLRLNAFTPSGSLRWIFFGDEQTTTNDLTAPDVSSRDGNIYINRNLGELYSLTPTPTVRWKVSSLLAQGPVPGPIVSPINTLVLMGGQETYGMPGLIKAFSTADGSVLFSISIPKEPDGTCAVPYARARFTRTGDRAYIPAVQLCVAPQQYHSWLYAIDITP
ncbi:MAG: PQQ-binding-like beta-propeller repeat protein [Verrucomicrobiota bacterium]|nr:PQQ-binding-like beta-propeller repeat protein [Verrucomicrobiota bacterium]